MDLLQHQPVHSGHPAHLGWPEGRPLHPSHPVRLHRDPPLRGAVYHITVDNAAGVQHGIKAVTVDGKAISGNILPLAAAGTEVTVQVTMG